MASKWRFPFIHPWFLDWPPRHTRAPVSHWWLQLMPPPQQSDSPGLISVYLSQALCVPLTPFPCRVAHVWRRRQGRRPCYPWLPVCSFLAMAQKGRKFGFPWFSSAMRANKMYSLKRRQSHTKLVWELANKFPGVILFICADSLLWDGWST